MTIVDLWVSGATDVFGYRFRDAWHVRGWEQGNVPPNYVCWLPSELTPMTAEANKSTSPQRDLFEEST